MPPAGRHEGRTDGDDRIYGSDRSEELRGGKGDDTIYGFEGNDRLYGGKGRDNLSGDGGDSLHGGDGEDTLFGGDGWDRLRGGDGDDTLFGGDGWDDLYGSKGEDIFVFRAGDGHYNYDRIFDFEDTVDRIKFEGGITFQDLTIRSSFFEAGTTVSYGKDWIILRDIEPADITESDFIFG